MEHKYTPFVNPFQGNGTTDLGELSGVAAAWHPIKMLAGNTHPGAQAPFGRMSVCAYSGAMASGYGVRGSVWDIAGEKLYPQKCMLGFSHIHHSGTGDIGYFYNYALTTAFFGELSAPTVHGICDEAAKAGYYAVTDAETGVRYEATVDNAVARHRYTFPRAGGRLAIDFANNGLRLIKARYRHPAGAARLTIIDRETVAAEVVQEGLTLYFRVTCRGAAVKLWENYAALEGDVLVTSGADGNRFGCVFDIDGTQAELKLSLSIQSAENAADFLGGSTDGFDVLCGRVEDEWEKMLSVIDIEADDGQKEIFYSNFYHTLVKPADFSGENLFGKEQDFLSDFSTLWDIYKTQTPLLFSLYPDISRKICNSYLTYSDKLGVMPNAFGLCADLKVEAQQARLLAAYLFCDAYWRGVAGVDFQKVVKTLKRELDAEEYKPFFQTGECERTTYTLDVAETCGNLADMAAALGCSDAVADVGSYAANVKNAFDPETGLLKENYTYYEGDHWSYSFRPLRDNEARVAICGKEKYVALLDRFFGFTHAEETQNRFQGFNNETDMEAPYAYGFADRHDRVCELMDAMTQVFGRGDGGLPGNADSGGLTACYIWNCLGLFPVTGQNAMMIGAPHFARATVKLANGNVLTVKRTGEGIYVKDVTFRGTRLPTLRMTVTDMMQGGDLSFQMTARREECRRK